MAHPSDSSRFRLSRGVICDALVFMMNLLFAKPLLNALTTGVKEFEAKGNGHAPPTALGWILASALVSYSAGCWLKRGPLQKRLGPSSSDANGCLFIAWLSLMVSLTILALCAIMADFNIDMNGWTMLLLFIAALTPVILGIRAMGAGNIKSLPAWRRNAWLEIPADILIIAAILPVSMIWSEWISGLFSQHLQNEGWGVRLFASGMSLGAFVLFYFAPRLVLIYGHLSDRFMWGTFAFAAAPSLRACWQ